MVEPAKNEAQRDFAWLPLAAVKPWRRNPRKNDRAIGPVAASMRRFGFVAPIVIWPGGDRMVAGHTRIKAMESILREDAAFVPRGAPGPGMVPVRFQEFANDAEADAYALADNKLAQIAEWDDEALADVQRDIAAHDADLLKIAGWTDDELAKLRDELEPAVPSGSLSDKFGVPPFTVLNAREGWWQDRKRAWLALGIRSELGRGEQLIPSGGG